ncbi:hypothetical protein [Pseudomonas benzenivorans]|uniref:Uncharacterized protein n=1 Tax=Pseudomonas benzenivorans TaxID=556533 RepID=A0ABY5HDK5_9PSED|nr:hypothetical protein [Pseudomonas benzenivorans]UTW09350.1 hypothetical protein KDW96_08640 [Pseudomonas benzenivorans]
MRLQLLQVGSPLGDALVAAAIGDGHHHRADTARVFVAETDSLMAGLLGLLAQHRVGG